MPLDEHLLNIKKYKKLVVGCLIHINGHLLQVKVKFLLGTQEYQQLT